LQAISLIHPECLVSCQRRRLLRHPRLFPFFYSLHLAASIVAFYLSFVASTVDEVLVLAEVSVPVEAAGAPESVAAGAAGAAGWEVILS
jgi:hypothetical protein